MGGGKSKPLPMDDEGRPLVQNKKHRFVRYPTFPHSGRLFGSAMHLDAEGNAVCATVSKDGRGCLFILDRLWLEQQSTSLSSKLSSKKPGSILVKKKAKALKVIGTPQVIPLQTSYSFDICIHPLTNPILAAVSNLSNNTELFSVDCRNNQTTRISDRLHSGYSGFNLQFIFPSVDRLVMDSIISSDSDSSGGGDSETKTESEKDISSMAALRRKEKIKELEAWVESHPWIAMPVWSEGLILIDNFRTFESVFHIQIDNRLITEVYSMDHFVDLERRKISFVCGGSGSTGMFRSSSDIQNNRLMSIELDYAAMDDSSGSMSDLMEGLRESEKEYASYIEKRDRWEAKKNTKERFIPIKEPVKVDSPYPIVWVSDSKVIFNNDIDDVVLSPTHELLAVASYRNLSSSISTMTATETSSSITQTKSEDLSSADVKSVDESKDEKLEDTKTAIIAGCTVFERVWNDQSQVFEFTHLFDCLEDPFISTVRVGWISDNCVALGGDDDGSHFQCFEFGKFRDNREKMDALLESTKVLPMELCKVVAGLLGYGFIRRFQIAAPFGSKRVTRISSCPLYFSSMSDCKPGCRPLRAILASSFANEASLYIPLVDLA